jgi:DNA-binding NarL/FixJ family response regulator
MTGSVLLGRTDEQAVIERFLASPAEEARLLVIGGDAGIGKTILWDAARERAAAIGDAMSLVARASEAERSLAHVTLTDLVDSLADPAVAREALSEPLREALDAATLRGRPAGPAEPRMVGMAILEILRRLSGTRRVLLFIDDAQWVDPASAAALGFAFRRLDDPGVTVIATVRTDDGPSVPVLEPLRRVPGATELRLGPVSIAVLHHLIVDRVGKTLTRPQLARVEAASGGNPPTAIELARALTRLERWPLPGEPLPLPADSATLLRDRIAGLAADVRDVLVLAAAMASPTVEAIATAGPSSVDAVVKALDEAAAVGLVETEVSGRIRFRHPLMLSAALESVPLARRRTIHARLAAGTASVEDRGRHLALSVAGTSVDGALALDAAAASARRRGATAMAAEWAERAAMMTPAEDRSGWTVRIGRAGRWFAEAGEIARGRGLLLGSLETMPAGDERAAAMLTLAQIEAWEAGGKASIRRCEQALQEAIDPDLRARLRLRIAVEPDTAGVDRAIRETEAAIEELEAASDDPDPDLVACARLQRASLRLAAGLGLDRNAVDSAMVLLAEEPLRNPEGDERSESLRAHALVWQLWIELDDLERAYPRQLRDFRRDIERGRERPLPVEASDLAMTELWLGDWAAADRHAEDARILAAQTGASAENESIALVARAWVDAFRGDLEAAEASARAGLRLVSEGDWVGIRHRAALGFIALSQGDAVGAEAVLGSLHDHLHATGNVEAHAVRFVGDLLEASVAIGRLDRASAITRELERSAATIPRPWVRTHAARGRALLHAADGDLDASVSAIAEALREADRLPMPFERARTHLIAGRIARRRKAKKDAAAHLDRARAMFADLGAKAWVGITDVEIARLGRRPATSGTLTETEALVARLAARGLTNRQVGEAAFLTPKSVEGVLARAYGKLGIRSRAELGAWLRGQDGEAS